MGSMHTLTLSYHVDQTMIAPMSGANLNRRDVTPPAVLVEAWFRDDCRFVFGDDAPFDLGGIELHPIKDGHGRIIAVNADCTATCRLPDDPMARIYRVGFWFSQDLKLVDVRDGTPAIVRERRGSSEYVDYGTAAGLLGRAQEIRDQ